MHSVHDCTATLPIELVAYVLNGADARGRPLLDPRYRCACRMVCRDWNRVVGHPSADDAMRLIAARPRSARWSADNWVRGRILCTSVVVEHLRGLCDIVHAPDALAKFAETYGVRLESLIQSLACLDPSAGVGSACEALIAGSKCGRHTHTGAVFPSCPACLNARTRTRMAYAYALSVCGHTQPLLWELRIIMAHKNIEHAKVLDECLRCAVGFDRTETVSALLECCVSAPRLIPISHAALWKRAAATCAVGVLELLINMAQDADSIHASRGQEVIVQPTATAEHIRGDRCRVRRGTAGRQAVTSAKHHNAARQGTADRTSTAAQSAVDTRQEHQRQMINSIRVAGLAGGSAWIRHAALANATWVFSACAGTQHHRNALRAAAAHGLVDVCRFLVDDQQQRAQCGHRFCPDSMVDLAQIALAGYDNGRGAAHILDWLVDDEGLAPEADDVARMLHPPDDPCMNVGRMSEVAGRWPALFAVVCTADEVASVIWDLVGRNHNGDAAESARLVRAVDAHMAAPTKGAWAHGLLALTKAADDVAALRDRNEKAIRLHRLETTARAMCTLARWCAPSAICDPSKVRPSDQRLGADAAVETEMWRKWCGPLHPLNPWTVRIITDYVQSQRGDCADPLCVLLRSLGTTNTSGLCDPKE
ncbi:F-box incomplete domain containing protein [Pandoravirus neocaledonia]|uniref:F-box incomplete domain containing protein n=1 Tax=Pandoravirus neocaledonia TaxID=2107708 RepID=A0A2U7UDC2_9VIRU|nr:F-box incomplete domain containing protein [Pandoravirus neocaledonia]AVK76355.1 F-box incomplete domain containing protein [Pandoravirus neocaledonia]